MKKIPVIYDGDMGGDDLWAIAIMLGHQHRFHVQGITTVFGNVSRDIATNNARNFLNALGYGHIPVFNGEKSPMDGTLPFGDDAYGENGVGGVVFPESPYPPGIPSAVNWMRAAILNNVQKTTIFATGPATNIAALVQKHPETVQKIERVIFMAGGDNPPGVGGGVIMVNGHIRRGNITPRAEFNAFQDPHALNRVIESGVACHFVTMDSNQHLVLTPERAATIRHNDARFGPQLVQMMDAVADLDNKKFGVNGPFIHDPNAVLYALNPDNYTTIRPASLSFDESRPGDLDTTLRGEVAIDYALPQDSDLGNVVWATGMKSAHDAFEQIAETFSHLFRPRKYHAPKPYR